MFEQIITSTKIIKTDRLTAKDLDKLIFYYGGEAACPAIITGHNPFPARDKMLDELRKIRPAEVLNKVAPDPKVKDVMEMCDELKKKPVNVLIGIGGGSAMDSAKGVAVILSNGGDLEEYFGAKPVRAIEKRDIALILIPTTAGTGSEVTKVGVFTDRNGRKQTLMHPLLIPDAAVLVNEYVLRMPPALTAATAFDALSHTLETLWNRNATPISDRAAIESAVHILKWMETAYNSSISGAQEGLPEMLEGACMAGTAFCITGTAAVHALSFVFSEEWHIPHGVACAFMLEDIFRLNCKDKKTKQQLSKIAEILYGKHDEDTLIAMLLDKIISLKRNLGMPFTFNDLNVALREEEIGGLFDKTLDDPKMKNNVIAIDRQLVHELIRKKFQ